MRICSEWRAECIGPLEVWTRRPFKARELVLCPSTTEMKDTYYTSGLSYACKYSNTLHPSSKFVAVDGRLRQAPTEDRSFSMFFAMARTTDKSQVNMVLHDCDISLKATIKLPHKRKASELEMQEHILDKLCQSECCLRASARECWGMSFLF